MAFEIPFIFQVLIFLVDYQYFLLAGLGIAGYRVFIKLFTMPLLTRNPQELILILSPGKTKIFKVSNRLLPLFKIKRAVYWYAEPLKINVKDLIIIKRKKVKKQKFGKKQKSSPDCSSCGNKNIGEFCGKCGIKAVEVLLPAVAGQTPAPIVEEAPKQETTATGSLLHIFVDAVNQPIYALERNETKVMDLVVHRNIHKEISGHNVFLPPRNSFGRNWILVINGNQCYIEKTTKKQPYKLSFFCRIGIYVVNEKIVMKDQVSSTTTTLEAVTVQKIVEEVGGVVQNANFSANFAANIAKNVRFYESRWVASLLGQFDMRVILIIMIMVAGIGMYIMFGRADTSSLGPPPPGLNVP